MTATVTCARCHKEGPRLDGAPYPGEAGEEVLAKICAACWAEWQQLEVMVINELRLNFMDPGAQAVLVKQMREFLTLDAEE